MIVIRDMLEDLAAILPVLCIGYLVIYLPIFCWKAIMLFRAMKSGHVCQTCRFNCKEGTSCCVEDKVKKQPRQEYCSLWEEGEDLT